MAKAVKPLEKAITRREVSKESLRERLQRLSLDATAHRAKFLADAPGDSKEMLFVKQLARQLEAKVFRYRLISDERLKRIVELRDEIKHIGKVSVSDSFISDFEKSYGPSAVGAVFREIQQAAASGAPAGRLAALDKRLSLLETAPANDSSLRLPPVAPEIFCPRTEPASQFLRRVWGSFLDEGVLYQHYLSKLDPALKQALDNEFKGRREELRALIPTQDDETEKLLGQVGLSALEGPERGRVATAIRRAKGLLP